jgi:hypothetical protein
MLIAPIVSRVGAINIAEQRLIAGGGFATAWSEQVGSTDHRILYSSVGWDASGTAAREQALATIAAAQSRGFDVLRGSHRAFWHAYWPASFLSIPDDRLQRFYWVQMYKLASATRADRPVYDLLGPWPTFTRWPGLWWNLNVQMTYWPVYAANRLSLGESLTRALGRALDDGVLVDNEPDPFEDDAGAIATTSTADLRSAYPLVEHCDLPWAIHNAWLQYRYSMDDELLRTRVVPLLERAMNHYLHRLTNTPVEGRLNLPAARSPEYATAPNPTIDVALLRWGLATLVATDERLALNRPARPLWEATLERLVDYPVDDTGLMIASGIPLSRSHRAFSHLLPILPLHLLSWDHPEDRPLMQRSIERWTGRSAPGLMGPGADRSGYSMAAASSLYSAMGRGDDALAFLDGMFGDLGGSAMTPNTFYSEARGYPTSETPMAGAAAIQDMLIQSFGDRVRVFPAAPSSWREIAFYELRAEGGFLVSAARANGRTQFISIESLAGAPCRLQSDLPLPWEAVGARPFSLTMEGEQLASIDLRAGERVIIRTRGTEPALRIAPVWLGPPPPITPPAAGCGCRLDRRAPPASLAWMAVGALIAAARRRRSRRQ